ncbi:hypothetical protein [Nocardia brasiliensis]|uniref:hypothetical protein n=1 Tax=Nocardia brasiliensis TaxID=37326 RepID=UPI003D8F1149
MGVVIAQRLPARHFFVREWLLRPVRYVLFLVVLAVGAISLVAGGLGVVVLVVALLTQRGAWAMVHMMRRLGHQTC